MATLLHIDSSHKGDASVSRRLTAEYTRNWRAANPDGRVVTRDLALTPPPPIDTTWIGAVFTPADARTESQRAAIALSETLIAELREADEYVIGAPLYNFNVSSLLKLWIDQIVRKDETFKYTAEGPVGLLAGKRATFVISSGGTYGPGTAGYSMNHVEPYLRTMFGFIGVEIDFVTAGGAAALNAPDADHDAFFAPHLAAVRAHFTPAAT